MGVSRGYAARDPARAVVHGYVSVPPPDSYDRGGWAASAPRRGRTEIPHGYAGLSPASRLVDLSVCVRGIPFAVLIGECAGVPAQLRFTLPGRGRRAGVDDGNCRWRGYGWMEDGVPQPHGGKRP